jgi:hypothetical protein
MRTWIHAFRTAIPLLVLCASLHPAASLAGDPGCPPSFCPLPDDPIGGLTNRLTLFPGTSSVVHDNDPNDENPACGILEVTARPFPPEWTVSGSAVFTGSIQLQTPTNTVGGHLKVTAAEILSSGDPTGGGATDFIPQELPLGCAAFYMNQPSGLGMYSAISGFWDTGADGGGMLVGGETWMVTSVATTLDVTSPAPDPAPSEVTATVSAPGVPWPAPYYVGYGISVYGTFQQGEGVIGLKVNGLIPEGESFHLPNSIVTTFGALHPPAIADGTMGSEPMRVEKLNHGSQDLSVSWDAESCEGDAPLVKLIYGNQLRSPGAAAMLLPTGAVCGIDAVASPFTWDAPAAVAGQPLLWWLLIADDGMGSEGSWGMDSSGVERNGPGPDGSSLECGAEVKNLTNTCGL